MKHRTAGFLAAALAALVAMGVFSTQAVDAGASVRAEVTVWRSVSDPGLLYISTRPQGGRWRTVHGALAMSATSPAGNYQQSGAVPAGVRLDEGGTAALDIVVWRSLTQPGLLYVSSRPGGGRWRTEDTPLDMSALDPSGRYHQSNAVLVDVPLARTAQVVSPPALSEFRLSDDPAFDVRVTGLRFYERGGENPLRNDRAYTSFFDRQATRYVGWEIALVYPRVDEPVSFEIESIVSGPRGEVARSSHTYSIQQSWTGSRHSARWGRAEPPFRLPRGVYRLDLRMDGAPIASGEFSIVDDPLPRTAVFAGLRASLPWGSPADSHDRIASLRALAELHRADPNLAATVASWAWVRQEPADLHRRTLQQLWALARADLQLAKDAADYPWLANDLTQDEWLGLRALQRLATYDASPARLVAQREWIEDGLTTPERQTIERLLTLATSGGGTLVRMPFLTGLSAADAQAVRALQRIAREDPLGFGRILIHPSVWDGISDEEARVVATLRPVLRYAPATLDDLLDPGTATLEERQVELPSGGTVPATLVRTESGAARTMDLAESALQFVDGYMGAPLPADHVIVHFGDSVLPGTFATNWGSHIVVPPTIEGEEYSPALATKHLAHEIAHYYWTGYEGWLEEGAANMLAALTLHSEFGLMVVPDEGPCSLADHIAAWEMLSAAGPDQISACDYSLGERLFHELHRTLGARGFQQGFRALHEALSSGVPSEACTGEAGVICEIRAAFTRGGTADATATVDAVISRWYSGEGAYDLSHLDGSPTDPAVASGQARITAAYISMSSKRAEHTPVQVFSRSEDPGSVYLILEFSLDRTVEPKHIPLVVEEAFEDGFLYRSRQSTAVFEPEWTSGWSRRTVGPPNIGDDWAAGRYFVYVYHEGNKVAEVNFDVTP